MIQHLNLRPSLLVSTRAPRRAAHVCHACGEHFTARPGDHLAAVYCAPCLDQTDNPVTAEHYWDLGGGG